MAFINNSNYITKQLRDLGAKVIVDNNNHCLLVNDKYSFSYTSSFYKYIDKDNKNNTVKNKTIGRGRENFVNLIKKEMEELNNK